MIIKISKAIVILFLVVIAYNLIITLAAITLIK